MTTHTDITIIGGGIVGLTLANLLAESDITIALIDHQPAPTIGLMQPYDARVSAINYASQNIFQNAGVWQMMQQLRVSRYHAMQVWDAGSPARLAFHATELGQAYLGHIIEHSVMRQALWQRLMQFPQLQLYSATQPITVIENPNHIVLQLSNEVNITTSLLVGADGVNSWVAKHTGLSDVSHATEECAIVATLRSELSHQHTAWQRFLSTGPIALLPLADPHLVSLVWSTTTPAAAQLMALDDVAFNQTLSQAAEHVVGNMQLCDIRYTFPLYRHHTPNYVKPHVALIGDAAHSILPLAGQGVNLGLIDAGCLAEVVQQAHARKRPYGELPTLRRYERWRKGENAAMLYAMEGFQRLFTNSTEAARHLRHFGFSAVQHLALVKKYFMQRAAGLHGDLPQCAIYHNLQY